MSRANLETDRVHQFLQVVLEEVLIGGVAAPAVAQQQDRRRGGVAALADAVPVPA